MSIFKNTKNSRWDSEWQSQIKALSINLDAAKQKQTSTLISEGSTLQTEKVKLEKEICQLKTQQQSLNSVFLYHQQAQKELKRLNDHLATQQPRQQNFLGTGTTKYRTHGWIKLAENHFTPSSGKLDNLYQVQTSGGTAQQTVEEQVINTMARVVKALEKVDATDFEAKYNAKESDAAKQAQVKAYLKEIQDQAKEIVVGSNKDGKQPTYDFSANYHKGKWNDNGTWQPKTTDYNQPPFDYQHFFDFITLVHNQPFLNDLDSTKQKDVESSASWQISLKGEAWEKDKLADYGIKIDSTKTTLYKTSETEKTTVPVSGGIKGWLELAHSITQEANNKSKLLVAFTNSPTQQLLSDLNGWVQSNGFLTDNANYTLPESVDSLETVIAELEADKISSATKKGLLIGKMDDKTTELKQKETQLTAKETEINTLIQEIITQQRTKLATYSITNGLTGQHKRSENELSQIQHLLLNLRYLENNGDSTLPSSVSAENTAYDQIEQIHDKVRSSGTQSFITFLVRNFRELAFSRKDDKEEYDLNQAIQRIKAGKYTDRDGKEVRIYDSAQEYIKHFEEKDKLVKLTDWEQAAWKALKEDKDSDEEKLSDWQSKLKSLDPLITETILTESKMKDFQKHVNFKKIEGVEGLIKKVLDQDAADSTKFKVKADFITTLKKEDAEIDDLAKMFTKLEAEKIIRLIQRFDYDKNLSEEEKKKIRRAYSWENKKKVGDKYVGEDADYSESNLTDSEKELTGDFTTFLFQLATSVKQLSSISKPTEQSDDNGNNPPSEEKGHFGKYWYLYAGGVLVVAALLGAAIYFWDDIGRKMGWSKNDEGESEED